MEQPKILVAIRKRPLSKKEASKGETDMVTVKNCDTVIVSEYKQKVDLTKFLEETIFNFDFAFNEETQNEEIYDLAVRPLVESAFQGARVTCFAYGQTGSGKTYTMNGNMGQGIPGLYTLGANDIFDYLASPQFRHLKAKLSFYEIYCGKLFDLLNKRNELKLREDNKNNINIIGLEEANVSSSEEFIQYLAQGSQQRVTSQNSANADSSRSHAILQISLKDGKKLHGKISFIDLAGNERGADHMDMDKQTRIDGAEINKSLLSLKECIRALDQGKGHTPFRGSKLTMVLKDSFVGFCRTVMIGNVSPSSASSQNTLNTLRYADRVKELRKPQENSSKEEQKAKEMMLPRQNKNAIRIMINNDDDAEDIARKRDEAQKQYGLAEEPAIKKTPLQKEEVNVRKNSFGGNKVNQLGKSENKSNSISKNVIGNSIGSKQPLTNNLVGQQQQNIASNRPNQAGNNRQKMDVEYEGNRYEQPKLNRYNSSNQQNPAGFGTGRRMEDSMDEQSNSAPYYAPSNKNIPSQTKIPVGINNQGRNVQPVMNNYSGLMGQQNISNNYSQVNMGGYQAPQMQGRTMSDQHGYQNNRQSTQTPQLTNKYPANYAYQNSSFQNNSFQNNYQNNSQYQFQNNNSMNFQARGQVQQPVYNLPENWEELASTVINSTDPEFNSAALAEMNKRLFHEENDLTKNHSETLRHEIEIIKSEMSLLNEIEVDRSKITSREYVRLMQESIEDKISMLEMLRERLINFTYKLDEMEEIENQGIVRVDHGHDEQLLDDIN